MKILLDTSFLMSGIPAKIEIVKELLKFGPPSMHVLDLVVRELESFADGKGKKARQAKLALMWLGTRDVRVIKTRGGHTDSKLVTYAANRGMTVCTVDRRLLKTLIRRGIPALTIRQGKYLARAKSDRGSRHG